MKLAVAVEPGRNGSVRITISCHNKHHFANRNCLAIRFEIEYMAAVVILIFVILYYMCNLPL